MRDEFAHSRLPDLPTAGYSTRRQRELTDGIMLFIRGIERDRLLLLSVVLDGPQKFRTILGKHWRHLNTQLASDLKEQIFAYLVLLAGPNPAQQRDNLLRMQEDQINRSSLHPPNSAAFGLPANLPLKSWRRH